LEGCAHRSRRGHSWPRLLTPETPSCIRPGSVGALVIKQCFRTYDFPRRCTRLVGQKIETGPAVTKRRSDHSQCLASRGKLARRKTAREQLERIHVWAKLSVSTFIAANRCPRRAGVRKRPSFVNVRLVAAQELSDLRGDAGNMNMQLVLAAASTAMVRPCQGSSKAAISTSKSGHRVDVGSAASGAAMLACRRDASIRPVGMWPFADVAAGAKPIARSLPQRTGRKTTSCLPRPTWQEGSN
jgi:hypothetical protein